FVDWDENSTIIKTTATKYVANASFGSGGYYPTQSSPIPPFFALAGNSASIPTGLNYWNNVWLQ
ncbi:MAG: hypothetical protein U1E02_15445, partial [Hydrogenophaga sp.]|nr:hypothetical protein [Hydrogenophaga sp.]